MAFKYPLTESEPVLFQYKKAQEWTMINPTEYAKSEDSDQPAQLRSWSESLLFEIQISNDAHNVWAK